MPRRIILDVDAGTDDALALLLLLISTEYNKDVEIVAITCVNGNTSVINVYVNVRRILKICNKEQIPVYIGAAEPLIIPENYFNSYFHGKDGFGDLEFEDDNITVKDNDYNKAKISDSTQQVQTKADVDIKTENAVIALNRIVMDTPGEISLICLAPLTNIALTMKVYPLFAKNLKEIFVMGGNHKGVGNIICAAEFNFHIDPEAAYIILHNVKCPITILTWETCLNSTITSEWRFDVLGNLKHPAIKLLNAAEKRVYAKYGKYWIPCDTFLAAAFLTSDIIKKSLRCNASVELCGSKTRAQMVCSPAEDNTSGVTIITEVDEDLFKNMLSKTFS